MALFPCVRFTRRPLNIVFSLHNLFVEVSVFVLFSAVVDLRIFFVLLEYFIENVLDIDFTIFFCAWNFSNFFFKVRDEVITFSSRRSSLVQISNSTVDFPKNHTFGRLNPQTCVHRPTLTDGLRTFTNDDHSNEFPSISLSHLAYLIRISIKVLRTEIRPINVFK